MNQSYNILIRKIGVLYVVTDNLWKCYRCDLIFRDDAHARMHQEINGHSVSRIKAITA